MTSVDHPFVCFVTELAREVFQREPLLYPRVVGSGPDYCFTQILGLPSVFVPYAGGNSETHGPNENMSLQAFFEGIFYSAALFSRFSECLFVGREDRYEPETS
jgi:acetylornithine deacetylase/succinyl-diaminopimelate desuccinylase-like protein